jgi:hypothetical protein
MQPRRQASSVNPACARGPRTVAPGSAGRRGRRREGPDLRREGQTVVDFGERQLDPEGFQGEDRIETLELLERLPRV